MLVMVRTLAISKNTKFQLCKTNGASRLNGDYYQQYCVVYLKFSPQNILKFEKKIVLKSRHLKLVRFLNLASNCRHKLEYIIEIQHLLNCPNPQKRCLKLEDIYIIQF